MSAILMTPNSHFQLDNLTGTSGKIIDLNIIFPEAFSLAVMMAKDVHDKFGNGQTIKIPVSPKKGNPLSERHVHLVP
jgi:hypothetical protein